MSLEHLLREISSINKKYEETAKISGENFNIFEILGLESAETSHSKLLATLLDPNGSHGQGNLFLEIFIKQVADIKDFRLDGDNVNVEIENFLGNRDDEDETGGRVDISITNGTEKIYIENKIYAGDGYKQLLRYRNDNPTHLIYLTLDGRDADEISTGGQEIEYIRLSYEKNILEWLGMCKKESADIPMLRETLSQYILLIKKLTGQARSNKMSAEYYDVITKDINSLSAAFDIANSIDEVRVRVFKERFLPLMNNLAEKFEKEHHLDFEKYDVERLYDKYYGFYFSKEEWNFKIGFEPRCTGLNQWVYACWFKDESKYNTKIEEVQKKVGAEYNLKRHSKSGMSIYDDMDAPYRNFEKDFCVKLLDCESEVEKIFEDKIMKMLSVVEKLEEELKGEL